ncbi:uncharacterized protein N7515_000331 [Penicillium bovifimosum]|uniref:Uncharacterized protein n=1 Tax=Penicillium bovifimosum TaxID=126998 RepID=A0A9W9LAZ8_9EURO|nr:uncharacterized protein N7515_000331 [Penicillium bovifimosum]KAJ5145767.1 hypothetical protein N7515_000331 [Penicillium bovifimosum]
MAFNPEKLHAQEMASPHLAKEDREVSLELIKRDKPNWQKHQMPEETDNWDGMYHDLRDQAQKDLEADVQRMKTAMDGINAKRALLTPKIIPDSESKHMAGAQRTWRQLRVNFLRRRDAAKYIHGPLKNRWIFKSTKNSSALTMPTKSLHNRASQIESAPIALVEEHRRPVPPSTPAPHPKAPAPSTSQAPPQCITRHPGMLPSSLQHPMLAQTGATPRPIRKITIGARRASSGAGSSTNVSATKKPVTASAKPGFKGDADPHQLPPRLPSSPRLLLTPPRPQRPQLLLTSPIPLPHVR